MNQVRQIDFRNYYLIRLMRLPGMILLGPYTWKSPIEMKAIILCNQPNRLKSALRGVSGPLRYLSLVESRESRIIVSYLRQIPDSQELSKAALLRERSESFRRKYIAFIARLNGENHSRFWWAMPFTNKSPLATPLCRNTSYFLLISELASSDSTPLVVITDSRDLAAQVTSWAKDKHIETKTLLDAPGSARSLLKRFTPAGLMKAFCYTAFFWVLSRRHKPELHAGDDYTLIVTLTHPSSFTPANGYQDVYFGALVEHLANSERRTMVLGLVQERPLEQHKNLRNLKFDIPVLPLEYFLTLGSILASAAQAFVMYARRWRIRGAVEIDGLDLRLLVERSVRDSCNSGELFMSLRVFHSARRVAQSLNVTRLLYPYENRSWEKMLLLGSRSASPETQMVGFQHGAINPSLTNLILEKEESVITPMPDIILTPGAVGKERLERDSNYPQGIIKSACALRRPPLIKTSDQDHRKPISRILVALSAGLDEYVNILTALDQALAGVKDFDVRIRPHPAVPIESALSVAPLSGQAFYSVSNGTLADDLQWTDLVIYASSTVGLEAVAVGIPAIYLDLGSFLNTDPMFGSDAFRWSVDNPAELVKVINSISNMPNGKFREAQRKGLEYAEAYLAPVTTSNLNKFLES